MQNKKCVHAIPYEIRFKLHLGHILLILLFISTQYLGYFHPIRNGGIMDRFNLKINKELLDRIRLMAKHYNTTITKMIIHLLEIGYMKMIDKGDDANEFINK